MSLWNGVDLDKVATLWGLKRKRVFWIFWESNKKFRDRIIARIQHEAIGRGL